MLIRTLQVRVEVESLLEGEDFSETLTRAKFEELNMDLFRGTLKPVQKVNLWKPCTLVKFTF